MTVAIVARQMSIRSFDDKLSDGSAHPTAITTAIAPKTMRPGR